MNKKKGNTPIFQKNEYLKVSHCPIEKEDAFLVALKHFNYVVLLKQFWGLDSG